MTRYAQYGDAEQHDTSSPLAKGSMPMVSRTQNGAIMVNGVGRTLRPVEYRSDDDRAVALFLALEWAVAETLRTDSPAEHAAYKIVPIVAGSSIGPYEIVHDTAIRRLILTREQIAAALAHYSPASIEDTFRVLEYVKAMASRIADRVLHEVRTYGTPLSRPLDDYEIGGYPVDKSVETAGDSAVTTDDIRAERAKQIQRGYTAKHDDGHSEAEWFSLLSKWEECCRMQYAFGDRSRGRRAAVAWHALHVAYLEVASRRHLPVG